MAKCCYLLENSFVFTGNFYPVSVYDKKKDAESDLKKEGYISRYKGKYWDKDGSDILYRINKVVKNKMT